MANGIFARVTFFSYDIVLNHALALMMMLPSAGMEKFQFFSEVFPVQWILLLTLLQPLVPQQRLHSKVSGY